MSGKSVWGILLSAGLSLWCLSISAQQFTPSHDSWGVDFASSGNYGAGVSVYDWDKDGKDDLSLLAIANAPRFFQNSGDSLLPVAFQGVPNDLEQLTHLTWVDYNNDGHPDISLNSRLGDFWLFRNDGNFSFTEVSEELFIFTDDSLHGHCWGDYDRDGDLDLYLSVYNAFQWAIPNILYRNDGTHFTNVTGALDVGNGTQMTFQSTWTDINHDLWPDLVIANDRWQNFNEIFLNEGGAFSSFGEESGFDYDIDSMTNTVGDFDNDGDLDIYITSTPVDGNHLFVNDGNGHFTEVGAELGIRVFDWCWSAQWMDIDNDGWSDLMVVGQPIPQNPNQDVIFKQVSPGQFEALTDSGIEANPGYTYCTATGDFNQDGAIDFVTHSNAPKNTEIWINEPPNGSYLRIRPEGILSNRDGIGTWMHVYAGDLNKHHYTLCGEAFMGQNSNWIHFGLSDHLLADSIILEWPSGHVDTYFNIPLNQSLHLIEGSSLDAGIEVSGEIEYCGNGEPYLLSAADGFSSYLWSNGATTQTIAITESGTYSVQVSNSLGLSASSDPVSIVYNMNPSVDALVNNESCAGAGDGSILLQSSTVISEVEWSSGLDGLNPHNLSAGNYTFMVIDENGCQTFGSAVVSSPDPIEVTQNVVHCSCPGSTDGALNLFSLNVEINSVSWSHGELGTSLEDLGAGTYEFILTASNGCSVSGSVVVDEPDSVPLTVLVSDPLCFGEASGSITLLTENIDQVSSISWSNGMNGFELQDLYPGEYSYTLITPSNCIQSGMVEVQSTPEIVLAPLIANSQTPGCEGLWSGQVGISGGTPPFTYDWIFYEEGVMLESLGQIPEWDCYSGGPDISVVLAVTDANGCAASSGYTLVPTRIGNPFQQAFELYPNPAKESFLVRSAEPGQLSVYTTTGALVLSELIAPGLNHIFSEQLSSGIYVIQVESARTVHRQTLIIADN